MPPTSLLLTKSITIGSLLMASIACLPGCAADTDTSSEGAADEELRASQVVGTYVATSTPSAAKAISELTLVEDGTYAATFLVAAACAGVDCNVVHEEGTFRVAGRTLSLKASGGATQSFGVTKSVVGLSLTSSVTPSPTGPAVVTTMRHAQWGGRGLSLQLSRSGANLRFDCASGSFAAPIAVDPTGAFRAAGQFRPGTGIQLPPGSPPSPVHGVAYEGKISGRTMALEFSVPGGSVSKFVLEAGSQGTLTPCL